MEDFPVVCPSAFSSLSKNFLFFCSGDKWLRSTAIKADLLLNQVWAALTTPLLECIPLMGNGRPSLTARMGSTSESLRECRSLRLRTGSQRLRRRFRSQPRPSRTLPPTNGCTPKGPWSFRVSFCDFYSNEVFHYIVWISCSILSHLIFIVISVFYNNSRVYNWKILSSIEFQILFIKNLDVNTSPRYCKYVFF